MRRVDPIYSHLYKKAGREFSMGDEIRMCCATAAQWFLMHIVRNCYECEVCGRLYLTPKGRKNCCPYWKPQKRLLPAWYLDWQVDMAICPACFGSGVHHFPHEYKNNEALDKLGDKCYVCSGHGTIPERGWRIIGGSTWGIEHPGEFPPTRYSED